MTTTSSSYFFSLLDGLDGNRKLLETGDVVVAHHGEVVNLLDQLRLEAVPRMVTRKTMNKVDRKRRGTVAGACQPSRWPVTLMDVHSLGKGM